MLLAVSFTVRVKPPAISLPVSVVVVVLSEVSSARSRSDWLVLSVVVEPLTTSVAVSFATPNVTSASTASPPFST